MQSTIPALLDLEKAIDAFRESIQAALEIGEVSEWDGEGLRERERSIRQASLILAGQCIALLIASLASHPQAHPTASARTQELRHPGSQGMGRQPIQVTLLGNVRLPLRLPYIRGTSKKRRQRRRVGQRGKGIQGSYYPFLTWLGMSEQVSPWVWTTVAHQGLLSSSFAVARENLAEWGIRLSEGRIQTLVYRFGEAGEAMRQEAIEHLRQGTLPTGTWLQERRVVVSVDGGRSRIRRNKRGKRRQGRRGYRGPWKEPKLLTIYCVDEQGQRLKSLEVPITNDGTLASVEGFMELLHMHWVRLGIVHAQQVLLVADGAEWIWSRLPALLKTLGVEPERVIELIDFYHATTHVHAFAEAVFSRKKEAKTWAKRVRSQLKRGHIKGVIKRMTTLAEQVTSTSKKKRALTQLAYFNKQSHRFDYQRVQALKLPIGSGAIESLIRQVINLRIKGTGKFWLQHHAELVLLGRCQWAAGQWDHWCTNILQANLSPKPQLEAIPLPLAESVVA